MPLPVGILLGPYEILAAVGAGGMGEVYRARDRKLNRDVALKILPPAFASDPDRLARFHREAQVLASLNHPNIGAIYGFEEGQAAAGPHVHALVLEFVDGPTLADRIAQGPIPVDEALAIAIQIAEALEAAHEQGIIHRDLKPANIKLRPDGTVKVLDFGLAKLAEPGSGIRDPGPEGAIGALSMSPTITSPAMMTGVGVILGTAAYMSPEQAKGRPADKRSDIWAFGCVFYEMLTGKQAFSGDDVTDFVVAVMTKEPDWTALPANMPSRVRRILRRSLAKDVRTRLRDIGDARLELEYPEPDDLTHAGAPVSSRRFAVLLAGLAGVFAILAITFAATYFRGGAPESSLTRLQLIPPEKSTFGTIAVSPDGRRLAFTTSETSGITRLWVRALDAAAQPLGGTDGASYPFWSPDGRFIGFFADHKLKKIGASGGSVQTICDLINDRGGTRGGTWGRDGLILFAAEAFGPESIYQVSASGGEPKMLATLEPSSQANHHHWPSFLPDGRHFLYFVTNNVNPNRTGIYLGALDGTAARFLMAAQTNGAYAPAPPNTKSKTDYVLFVRERTLMAQAFDPIRMELVGDAAPVAQEVGVNSSVGTLHSNFSVSANGTLVYGAGDVGSALTWIDRNGKPLGVLGSAAFHVDFRISPDGREVVAQREDGRGGADVWRLDVARGTAVRFTADPEYHAGPLWTPDQNRITYFAMRGGGWELMEKAANREDDEEVLLKGDSDFVTQDWSPDGRFLLYGAIDRVTRKTDLWIRQANAGQFELTPFVRSPFDENFARFSSGGKWIAYQSDESGRYEIYVRPVSPNGRAGDGKWQVSTNGGIEARWSSRSNELFYIGPDNMMMAVDVNPGPSFQPGVPRPLFPTRPAGVSRFDVTADGQRFLVAVPTQDAGPAPATIILNWLGVLNGSAPVQ